MEVADRIVVMNEGHIEQIGTPAEIYDHPASPFVMSFVGAVNMLASGAVPVQRPLAGHRNGSWPAQEQPVFFRPHDVEVSLHPGADTVPARLRRLSHMGRDLQVEVVLESGEVVMAQVPRDQLDHTALALGDQVHIVSRQARTFVPDYSI